MTTSSNLNEHESLGTPEQALVRGWLKDVDLKLRTAALYVNGDRRAPLRFSASMGQEMIRLQTEFVTVSGQGWISDDDQWIVIDVEEITRPEAKPFDLDEFLNNPNPRTFDPDKIVRASEPFDVDEFLRCIYEARGRP